MSRANLLLFGAPALVLLLLPLVCWAVGYCFQDRDFSLFLLVVVISWVEIPAMILGKPFFEHGPGPADIGHYPNGFLGWVVLILFYALASLAVSFLLRAITRMMSGRHLTNR
jgi:drug/metabolite transporter (DMT)-like permease